MKSRKARPLISDVGQKMSGLLYKNEKAAPTAFQEAMRVLLGAGYSVVDSASKNRDGVAMRLKKEDEEIWLEWFDTDALVISSVRCPSDRLKKEISLLLESSKLSEVRVI